jgi:hypothetical protein
MQSTPSGAAQIIVTIIPIVGIVMGATVIFFYLLWNYKQKAMMIDKGIYRKSELDIDSLSLFSGLILFGIGFSLFIFFYLKEGFGYSILSGLVPFSIGVSLIAFFVMRRKLDKDKNDR